MQTNGITTLEVSFFNSLDTPELICEALLDYIEYASKYLKPMGYKKVGIWGVS